MPGLSSLAAAGAAVRPFVRKAALLGVAGVTVVPTSVAAGLTAVDMVKRRGRKARPAQRPGTFEATAGDSRLTIFTSGEDLYEDMLREIDAAEHSVKLETFIWKADETGQRFLEAVNRAAERGVDVWVSYDGFANTVVPRSFYRQFSDRVNVYRMPGFARPYWRGLLRHTGFNHSKILVIDRRIGYIGGFNIGDDYAHLWRDTHVKEVGPAVWGLDHSISTVWNASHGPDEQMEWFAPASWDQNVSVASNLPVQLVYPIRGTYLNAIDRATRSIRISTPYFVPDQQVLNALKAAAERGVDVQVMVPKDSNHIVADWASRGFTAEMLESGITVLLYTAGMIHAKTATIDGAWSTVGTANIDRLSLGYNYETNLEVVNEEFAARMEEVFEADKAHCETVDAHRWRERHKGAQVIEALIAPLRPLL
jgi:cardiolipin synthase A/B